MGQITIAQPAGIDAPSIYSLSSVAIARMTSPGLAMPYTMVTSATNFKFDLVQMQWL